MQMDSILKDFDKQKERFESFAKSMRSLLNSLIIDENISIHSISSRVKDRDSLERKIEKKGNYKTIGDITDVVGLRIITHFADEVDLIAKIIESEFHVDRPNSIDKRASLEPDRFGYLSLHYVVELNKSRKKLKEYNPYNVLKAEIQIRSILQHTWAEIEHDIGYKSSIEVPHLIKRQFSRLAGLLELADSEFINIKKSLVEYKKEVAEEIENNINSKEILLDKISFEEYLKASPLIKNMTSRLESESPAVFTANSQNVSPIRQLHYFGIKTIKNLDDEFKRLEYKVYERAKKVISDLSFDYYKSMPAEILGAYLCQALATETNDIDRVKDYLIANNIKKDEDVDRFASSLLEFFSSIT